MNFVTLKSKDGELFHVPSAIAKASGTIRTLLEDIDIGEDDEPIPLFNVNSEILKKVLAWLTHHKDDPPPESEDDEDYAAKTKLIEIGAWDTEFFNVDLATKTELISAANYLDVPGLLDVACKAVAKIIETSKVETIREMFGIVHDFTPEEEEQLRKENEWAELEDSNFYFN